MYYTTVSPFFKTYPGARPSRTDINSFLDKAASTQTYTVSGIISESGVTQIRFLPSGKIRYQQTSQSAIDDFSAVFTEYGVYLCNPIMDARFIATKYVTDEILAQWHESNHSELRIATRLISKPLKAQALDYAE